VLRQQLGVGGRAPRSRPRSITRDLVRAANGPRDDGRWTNVVRPPPGRVRRPSWMAASLSESRLGRGFVEDQNARIGGGWPRAIETPLAARRRRELHAPLPHHRVVTLFEATHELVAMGDARRLLDVLAGRVRPGRNAMFLRDGAVEQEVVLQHHTEAGGDSRRAAASRGSRPSTTMRPDFGRFEGEHEVDQGALARLPTSRPGRWSSRPPRGTKTRFRTRAPGDVFEAHVLERDVRRPRLRAAPPRPVFGRHSVTSRADISRIRSSPGERFGDLSADRSDY